MKHKIIAAVLALCLVLVCLPLPSRALDVSEAGLSLHYDEETKVLTLSGNGPLTVSFLKGHELTDARVLVIEEGITEMPEAAFLGYSNLEEVTLAASVYWVGDDAFRDCASLKKFTVKNSRCYFRRNVLENSKPTVYGYMDSTAMRLAWGMGLGFADLEHPEKDPVYYEDTLEGITFLTSFEIDRIVGLREAITFHAESSTGVDGFASVTVTADDPEAITVEPGANRQEVIVTYQKTGTFILTASIEGGLTDTATVTVGTPAAITLGQALQPETIYTFTPQEDGKYVLYSDRSRPGEGIGMCAELAPAEGVHGIGSIESTERRTFSLEAGKTYALWTNHFSSTPIFDKAAPAETLTLQCEYLNFASSPAGNYVGNLQLLWARCQPMNADLSGMTWKSDNDAVAAVDTMGDGCAMVDLCSPGTATITAMTESGVSASYTLTVRSLTDAPVLHLGDTPDLTGNAGQTYAFTPEESGDYLWCIKNDDINGGTAVLRLSDSGVPEQVESHNVIYGGLNGVCAAMEAGKTYYLSVAGSPINDNSITWHATLARRQALEGITLSLSQLTAYPGRELSLLVLPTPEYSLVEGAVTWTSSDESVVKITNVYNTDMYMYNNVIDFLTCAPGTATITAKTPEGMTATCQITVKATETIRAGETKTLTLHKGERTRFSFTPEESGIYVWYTPVGDTYVSPDGENTGECGFYLPMTDISGRGVDYTYGWAGDFSYEFAYLEAGKTYYLDATYAFEGVDYMPDACTATVSIGKAAPLSELALETQTMTVAVDTEGSYSLSRLFRSPLDGIGTALTWTSSDETIVSIVFYGGFDISSCYFLALQPGEATITCTAPDGRSVSCQVTVLADTYDVTEGTGACWTIGSDKPLAFRVNGPMTDVTVYVDGQAIDPKNYTLSAAQEAAKAANVRAMSVEDSLPEGNTVVTLTAAYLQTLGSGEHTLLVGYPDGAASTVFYTGYQLGTAPSNPENPKTGDLIPGICLLLVLGALTGAAVTWKKRTRI